MAIQGSYGNTNSSSNEGSTQNQNSSSSSNRKRKGRGLAKKTPLWGKTQLLIDFDESGNPCGGEYKQLATQLGFLVKDGTSFPLTTQRWDQMDPTVIENIWKDIQSNTNASSHERQYCISSMGDKWRDWKSRMKAKGYYAYEIDEERLANCPVGVLENQWRALVSMWVKEEIREIANTNKANRSMLDCLPHTGKKPMDVLKKERSDQGLPVDRLNLFIASRKGATDATTKDMIEELQRESDELKASDQDTPEELEKLFVDHFGKDGHGRMRCSGHGITPSMVYGRKLWFSTTETVAAIRAEFEEKFELQKKETEARIQAERDACRVEMELQFQAFKQELLSQFQSQLQSKTG